jgi:hypothetical protein
MVRSALWNAQDALYALLGAAGTLNGAQLSLGRPTRDEPSQVWVSGETEVWNAEYAISGLGAKDETFTMRVNVQVTRLGTEYVKARDDVKELGQAVEDVIADNPTLSGTVELAQISASRLAETLTDERHRTVALQIDVSCRAWLNA